MASIDLQLRELLGTSIMTSKYKYEWYIMSKIWTSRRLKTGSFLRIYANMITYK